MGIHWTFYPASRYSESGDLKGLWKYDLSQVQLPLFFPPARVSIALSCCQDDGSTARCRLSTEPLNSVSTKLKCPVVPS
ncbi:hypothetical protein H9L39_13865 [Fusarium oxysporum f. sp. albedinis]|nr:hypothetical protein H9L39_13865 [Fusarium oxysporum f. sp. albedinis]